MPKMNVNAAGASPRPTLEGLISFRKLAFRLKILFCTCSGAGTACAVDEASKSFNQTPHPSALRQPPSPAGEGFFSFCHAARRRGEAARDRADAPGRTAPREAWAPRINARY